MKNYSRLILSLVLALFAGSIHAEDNTKNNKLIGVILPFTSAFSGIANEQKNAIELALQEYSDIEVIYKDSKSDAAGSVVAFNELLALDHPPFAVISCASWVATALHPLAADADIHHTVIASASFKRTVPKHTIRFTIDASQEENQLANYLDEFSRIAIFNMDNSYGNGWKKTIQNNMNDKIVIARAYDPQDKDFTKDLMAIKNTNPDALVLLSAGNAALIAKQAREMGITAQFVGTRPIERPELLAEAKYTDGLIFTYPTYDIHHPMIASFTRKYGEAPTIFGVEAYAAINSLITSANEGNHSVAALFDWYAGSSLSGALGKISFDEVGDAHYPYMYKEIVNGEFVAADFQYGMLLEKARDEIEMTLHNMDKNVSEKAKKMSGIELAGKNADTLLRELFESTPYSFDCITIDTHGVVKNVYPQKYSDIIGEDICEQPQIQRLHSTREPVMSEVIQAVEGIRGIDLEHPIFDDNDEFIGSLSILFVPDFFGKVLSRKMSNFPIEMWVMQKDGTIVYDDKEDEIGLNVLDDQADGVNPSFIKVMRNMAATANGNGTYTLDDNENKMDVTKKVNWTTIAMHGTEFRLALTHIRDE